MSTDNGSPFLRIGITAADFHTLGNTASIKERLTILVTGVNNVGLSSFSMHISMPNMSLVLEAFSVFIVCKTSDSVTVLRLKIGSELFIRQIFRLLDGKLWAIVDTDSIKKLLKTSATWFVLFVICPFILISKSCFLFVSCPTSFFS